MGREVILAPGRAPWSPRRIGDRDAVLGLLEPGFMDADATRLPKAARLFANTLATGLHMMRKRISARLCGVGEDVGVPAAPVTAC